MNTAEYYGPAHWKNTKIRYCWQGGPPQENCMVSCSQQQLTCDIFGYRNTLNIDIFGTSSHLFLLILAKEFKLLESASIIEQFIVILWLKLEHPFLECACNQKCIHRSIDFGLSSLSYKRCGPLNTLKQTLMKRNQGDYAVSDTLRWWVSRIVLYDMAANWWMLTRSPIWANE